MPIINVNDVMNAIYNRKANETIKQAAKSFFDKQQLEQRMNSLPKGGVKENIIKKATSIAELYKTTITAEVDAAPLTPPTQTAPNKVAATIENIIRCRNVIDAQLDILESYNKGASLIPMILPLAETPTYPPISLEFEFSNDQVLNLREDANGNLPGTKERAFNDILALLMQEANKRANGCANSLGPGTGNNKKCTRIKVQSRDKAAKYWIEYDWDDSCIEVRLVMVPINLWDLSIKSQLENDIETFVYGVCTATNIGSVTNNNKPDFLVANLSTIKPTPSQPLPPLQCHVNIDMGVFNHPCQVLTAYSSVMSQTPPSQTESEKINSGIFADREVQPTGQLSQPINPIACALTPIPNLPDKKAESAFNVVCKALATDIFNGTKFLNTQKQCTSDDVCLWLNQMGMKFKIPTSKVPNPSADAVNASTRSPHYLALNVEHGWTKPSTSPRIECRRNLMPTNAKGTINLVADVLEQIVVPHPQNECSIDKVLSAVETLAESAGVRFPDDWAALKNRA